MKRLVLLTAAVVAVAALAAGAALAGNVATSATVSGTPGVGLNLPASVSFGSTMLDGTDQTLTTTASIDVADATGSGNGWHITATSTHLSNGTVSLADTATTITGASAACKSGYTCTVPTNSITYPLTLPAGATAPAAVSVFSAAANSGMGDSTVSLSLSLAIPGNSMAGSYSGTDTLAGVSTP